MRGLTADLAREVAVQLMAKDPLAAHARDELGISEMTAARPLQAAFASAVFCCRWFVTVLVALLTPVKHRLSCIRRIAAAAISPGRVALWGAAAMLFTALIGNIIGATL